MSDQLYDVVIVGAGPAGMTAGIYAARAGLSAAIVESNFVGGQASTTNELSNYPGFPEGIGGPELMMLFEEQTRKLGVQFIYEQATGLALKGDIKRVILQASEVSGRSVVLAMGARRRNLNVPGELQHIGRGISYCATCDGHLYSGKRVAVVGGGNTAMEDALYLARRSDVFLIHRRDSFRATPTAVNATLNHPRVSPILNAVVERVDGEEGTLRLHLAGAEADSIVVDGLFIAIGTEPNTELLNGQVRLDSDGYVDAGEDAKTSLSGVFVAGDIRAKPLRQVVTAVSDGAMAASAAARYLQEHI